MSAVEPRRIAIVTTGRFHVLDLARELDALGHGVDFFSYVPRERCEQFGLPRRCHRALLPYVLPLLAAQSVLPRKLARSGSRLINRVVDRVAAARLSPVDVFIGMSGTCVESARAARRTGAKVFIERGSRHILSQIDILKSVASRGVSLPAPSEVRRELWGYEFADVIVVPSRHAEQSFIERGIAPAKLFRNPYGVDVSMFPATPSPQSESRTVIFAGNWSLQKGCDVLWSTCQRANSWKLLHVGAVGDYPLPFNAPLFEHVGSVSQDRLLEYYSRSDVAVLPSRQDGYGVVLNQAAACGLPIVCTTMTGGADLRDLIGGSEYIHVVPPDNAEALRDAIDSALSQAAAPCEKRDYLGDKRHRLSWQAYGRRYSDEIERRRIQR